MDYADSPTDQSKTAATPEIATAVALAITVAPGL
jgi:hypothetical protein